MRGHIVKRGKESYSIVISLGKDAGTNKYKYSRHTVKGSKKNAEKRFSELLHQMDTGTMIKPGKTTLAEYLNHWLADYARPILSPRGFESYESIARMHLIPSLRNSALTQLRPEHLQKHYTAKLNSGLSAGMVR